MVEDDILFTNHPRASMCNSYTFSTFILVPGFNSCQSFDQWLKVLANLTNLPNLVVHNLGKTQKAMPYGTETS